MSDNVIPFPSPPPMDYVRVCEHCGWSYSSPKQAVDFCPHCHFDEEHPNGLHACQCRAGCGTFWDERPGMQLCRDCRSPSFYGDPEQCELPTP